MNRFDVPESIFAPIVAAVPPDVTWGGFTNSLIAAARGIPQPEIRYRVKRPGSFKSGNEIRVRATDGVGGEDAKPFTARAYCYDKLQGTKQREPSHTHWGLAMTNLRDGLCAPAVPDDYDTGLLQVIFLAVNGLGVSAAPQLALLRHLWAESVRAASPDAIIFGGQHHWDDSWWTESVTVEAT